jgi:SAM-dependent methyltransferase
VQPEAYHRLAAREDTYWWHRARRRLAGGLLRRFDVPPQPRVIELGCGCGGNLGIFDELKPALVVGLDLSPLALDLARQKKPGSVLVRCDLSRPLPFADGSFDLATVFHVLYHGWVDDQRAALGRVARLLRPGGLLLLTEPAFAMLRRGFDRAVMGQRRYSIAGVRQLADGAGLTLVFASYFTSFAFPVALAGAALDRIRGGASSHDDFASVDYKPLRQSLNETLFRIAALEADAIVRGWRIPLGVGLLAVLRKG